MKRKILILPSWYPTHRAPVWGIFVQDQALVLSAGYEVLVLVPSAISWRQVLRGNWATNSRMEGHGGFRVYRRSTFTRIPGSVRCFFHSYMKAAQRGFEEVVGSWGKPDILHAQVVLPAGWAAAQLGKQYNIPVVLTEHCSQFSVHLRTEFQRVLVKHALTQASTVIGVSPGVVHQIRQFEDDIDVNVVGNVIRTEFFTPAERTQEKRGSSKVCFLFVGLLSEQKGVSYLIESARLLLEEGLTSFELLIGGDGSERSHLERLAKRQGLSSKCHFLGLLTPHKVRDYIRECDALVLPSLHESFGIVVGEAMACGKPVIATRSGGPEFIVTPETGLIVEIADPVGLANAMKAFVLRQVSYDPVLIRRSIVERFGEAAFLQNMSAIYEKILTG